MKNVFVVYEPCFSIGLLHDKLTEEAIEHWNIARKSIAGYEFPMNENHIGVPVSQPVHIRRAA
jgi:hypothetical protein